MTEALQRCSWAGTDPLAIAYHDAEWGVPSHDDRHLFEMLTLEGAQAGLAWITILRKREGYRRAFDEFEIRKIARYTPRRIEKLLADAAIVRNRLKVESTVNNARVALAVIEEVGSLHAYLWRFVAGQPIVNHWKTLREIPPRTADSDRMSRELKQRGFRFVGSTICYAFMQAVGMVNDHEVTCFRRNPDESRGAP